MSFTGEEKAPHSPFTFIETAFPTSSGDVYTDYENSVSGHGFDLDVQLNAALRIHYPHHILTTVPASNCDLIYYAAAGHARAEIDTESENALRFRGFIRAPGRSRSGSLGDAIRFARYNYKWLSEEFIIYKVQIGLSVLQYVLKEAAEEESLRGHSKATDALIQKVGEWQIPDNNVIYVFDNYWTANRTLWQEVQKANWDDVILDEDMKKALVDIVKKFFDSKDVYDDLGVPWKRGVIFHGPAGNGKTISIKALMHTLGSRKDPIPTLYVKNAPQTYHLRSVFQMARNMSPCLLVLEDIDTIVTHNTRSYFFNEVDGLEKNDGIMMVGSTNHLDQLDPGLSKRPSRFDRKYLFPLPSRDERVLYCDYWRNKLHSKPKITFPKKLSPAIADITDEFSFAYLKEAFVATLLVMAARHSDGADDKDQQAAIFQPWDSDKGDDLEQYELYREMKTQVKILRDDMANSEKNSSRPIQNTTAVPNTDVRLLDDGSQPSLTSTAALKRDLAIRGINNGMPKREETSRTSRVVKRARILGKDIDFLPDGVLQGLDD